MKIIEIIALDNGAHNNQEIMGVDPSTFPVPEGWAVLPDDMVCENFPFGEITVDESTPPVVTAWTPGVMPEPEPEPEPTPAEKREEAYNTERIIAWDGGMLTVTEAAQLWQYYAAEGSEKANELTVLIAEAKAAIREKYPDEA